MMPIYREGESDQKRGEQHQTDIHHGIRRYKSSSESATDTDSGREQGNDGNRFVD